MITHLEPDILEYKVKWALGNITMNKASRGPVELFQILKDDAVKVLHSICQQIWKTQQWPRDWKSPVVSFHSNPKERQCQRMFNLPNNCTHLTGWQDYIQNPSSQASSVSEPRTSRSTSWVKKRQENQRSNCQHPLDHRKSKRIPERKQNKTKHLLLLYRL